MRCELSISSLGAGLKVVGIADLRESRLLNISCFLVLLWWERRLLCSWGALDIRYVDGVGRLDVGPVVGFAKDQRCV